MRLSFMNKLFLKLVTNALGALPDMCPGKFENTHRKESGFKLHLRSGIYTLSSLLLGPLPLLCRPR